MSTFSRTTILSLHSANTERFDAPTAVADTFHTVRALSQNAISPREWLSHSFLDTLIIVSFVKLKVALQEKPSFPSRLMLALTLKLVPRLKTVLFWGVKIVTFVS